MHVWHSNYPSFIQSTVHSKRPFDGQITVTALWKMLSDMPGWPGLPGVSLTYSSINVEVVTCTAAAAVSFSQVCVA